MTGASTSVAEGWPGAGLEGLVAELRTIGLPISVADQVDAVRSLSFASPGDAVTAKAGLRATLVKDWRHESIFDAVFDLYFGASAAVPEGEPGETLLGSLDDASLEQLILDALRAGGSSAALRAAVAAAVDRWAGIEAGRPVGGTYYVFKTIRALGGGDLDGVLAEQTPGFADADSLGQRLMRDEASRAAELLRQEVEAEIRRRLVADRGADDVARTLRVPLPDDAAFLTASAGRIAAMQDVIAPIARVLESRLVAKHRAHRRGTLDFRRTVRRSLSTGGVPVDPAYRRARPPRPNVVVLADISSSVATFAGFALQLIYALRASFGNLQTFVFVDGLTDVSEILATTPDIRAAAQRINAEASGVWLDASSDYGNVLNEFWKNHGGELSWRTVVIVLGDARGNYRAPRVDAIRSASKRVGRLYWLNPEPRAMWDTGDSVISEYAPLCDGVFECRTLRQLRAFVDAL